MGTDLSLGHNVMGISPPFRESSVAKATPCEAARGVRETWDKKPAIPSLLRWPDRTRPLAVRPCPCSNRFLTSPGGYPRLTVLPLDASEQASARALPSQLGRRVRPLKSQHLGFANFWNKTWTFSGVTTSFWVPNRRITPQPQGGISAEAPAASPHPAKSSPEGFGSAAPPERFWIRESAREQSEAGLGYRFVHPVSWKDPSIRFEDG